MRVGEQVYVNGRHKTAEKAAKMSDELVIAYHPDFFLGTNSKDLLNFPKKVRADLVKERSNLQFIIKYDSYRE